MNDKEDYKFDVSIRCFTYNQAGYIEDAMNGFTMQNCNFPFVCCIVDDNSTDGEPDVILKYLQENFETENRAVAKISETDDYIQSFAQHKFNKNCFFAVLFLKYNHYRKKSKMPYIAEWNNKAKYCAICEGDDYWTDPMKLQKQYDYMESHIESSMCFHSHWDLLPDGTLKEILPKGKKLVFTVPDILKIGDGIIATNSIFYRNSFLQKEETPDFWRNCPVGDIPLRLFFASKGDVGFLDEMMSVYRRDAVGGWTNRKTTLRQRTQHRKKIINMYESYNNYTKKVYNSQIKKIIIRIWYLIIMNHIKTFLNRITPRVDINKKS